MTVYLHIGAHKTATTSLQKLVKENRHELTRQNIWSVPRIFPDEPSFARLTWIDALGKTQKVPVNQLDANPHFQVICNAFSSRRPAGMDLLISDESIAGRLIGETSSLYPHAGRRIDVLSQVFRDEPLRVILYIRHQDTFIESAWMLQVIRGRTTRTFDDFFAGIDCDALSWCRVADDIARVVGPTNLQISAFEGIHDGFEPWARTFFSMFCDPAPLHIRPLQANPGLRASGIALSRFLAGRIPRSRWKPVRWTLQKLFAAHPHARTSLIDPSVQNRLREQYADDYRDALARFGQNAAGWTR